MKLKTFAVLVMMALFSIKPANSLEIVYSTDDLDKCTVIAEYNKTIRMKASRKNVERKLTALGIKDDATHVYVAEYIDNTETGKGITVNALAEKCD